MGFYKFLPHGEAVKVLAHIQKYENASRRHSEPGADCVRESGRMDEGATLAWDAFHMGLREVGPGIPIPSHLVTNMAEIGGAMVDVGVDPDGWKLPAWDVLRLALITMLMLALGQEGG